MKKASLLREAVKTRFYPLALERGFVRGLATSLMTPFHRISGDRVHWFEIQWDKYHRPFFVLNFSEFSVAEAGGVTTAPALFPPATVSRDGIGRLQRKKGGSLSGWFRLKKPLSWQLLTLQRYYSPDEVADQLIEAFEELEAWWENGTEGLHICFM